MIRFLLLVAAVLLTAAGCASTTHTAVEQPPDEQFGHRFEGTAEDGRETLQIAPSGGDQSFQSSAAPVDEVHIRPAPGSGGSVPVEVLIKGAFPDGCSELNGVTQSRSGVRVDVTLEMRRPRGALCAAVMRPYRFYLSLDGAFAPGSFTLVLNGKEYPFVIGAR